MANNNRNRNTSNVSDNGLPTNDANKGRDTDGSKVAAPSAPQETPRDINSPTISGFTAETNTNGTSNVPEQPGVKVVDLDNLTKLRDALSNVIGYQTGSLYRHDFESGLETIRSFGLTVNVDRADADATKVQEDVLANDRGNTTPEQDKAQDNPADAPVKPSADDNR